MPRFYVEYLEKFGKQSGDLFLGFDMDMHHVLYLKESARFGVPDFEISENSFVFRGQQDHTFLYFLVDSDPVDPPVYVISQVTCEDDPESWDAHPYRDNLGIGWSRLSHFLALFILERGDKDQYDKFLEQIDKIR